MDNTQKQPNYLAIIFSIIELVFVISIGAIIINIISQSNNVKTWDNQSYVKIDQSAIENIELQNNYLEDIARALTETIALNTPDFSVSDSSATIREDSISLVEFPRYTFNALSFIVDIPNLEQSYQVYYKYPTGTAAEISYGENPYAILCLDDSSQIIYSDFNCHTPYPANTRQKIVTEYSRFLEFDNFTISFNESNPTLIEITPATNVADAVGELYIAETKSAIKSLGVSPNSFTYKVTKPEDLNFILPENERY